LVIAVILQRSDFLGFLALETRVCFGRRIETHNVLYVVLWRVIFAFVDFRSDRQEEASCHVIRSAMER
jgi:hypothetical protein